MHSLNSCVWSAAPTPLTEKMTVDTTAVHRMVKHHIRLGVRGLFLCGTNGEGPWLPEREKRRLIEAAVRFTERKLPIAVQVTDNSAARILENMQTARDLGASIAVIAPPYFMVNVTAKSIRDLYVEAIRKSPLPVGIYDRGALGPVVVPDSVMQAVYAEPKVHLVKDSSSDPARREIALAARKRRPELRLLNGNEFRCVEYLQAGYDGLLLGGGVFNGFLASRIVEAVSVGDAQLADRLQARMNRIMWSVYGGKKLRCWLSGEKKLMVEMGIFRTYNNFPNYPLTTSCVQAIKRVIEKDADVLLP